MRIKETAAHLGVSARILRHYEKEGLVIPARDASGYRRYSPRDLEMAGWVRDLIGAGFSTRELRAIAAALAGRPPVPGPGCRAAMREKLGQIDGLAARLATRRKALSDRLAALEGAQGDKQGASDDEDSQHIGAPLLHVAR